MFENSPLGKCDGCFLFVLFLFSSILFRFVFFFQGIGLYVSLIKTERAF